MEAEMMDSLALGAAALPSLLTPHILIKQRPVLVAAIGPD